MKPPQSQCPHCHNWLATNKLQQHIDIVHDPIKRQAHITRTREALKPRVRAINIGGNRGNRK